MRNIRVSLIPVAYVKAILTKIFHVRCIADEHMVIETRMVNHCNNINN